MGTPKWILGTKHGRSLEGGDADSDAVPPEEVLRVHKEVKKSAIDAGLPSNAAYLEQSRSKSGVWMISDNYERFTSLMLVYRNGQWFTKELTSGEPESGPISFVEAMANARLFFHG